jgi:elongation factor P hydroxylase
MGDLEHAAIIVVGPVQCGKSRVMLRLKQVLEEEFGAAVVLDDELKCAEQTGDANPPQDWEKKMVGETVWHLTEKGVSQRTNLRNPTLNELMYMAAITPEKFQKD